MVIHFVCRWFTSLCLATCANEKYTVSGYKRCCIVMHHLVDFGRFIFMKHFQIIKKSVDVQIKRLILNMNKLLSPGRLATKKSINRHKSQSVYTFPQWELLIRFIIKYKINILVISHVSVGYCGQIIALYKPSYNMVT